MTAFTRRRFVQGIGLALTASAIPNSRVFANQGRLTVASYGGIFEQAMRKTFVAYFEKKTGMKADIHLGNPSLWVSQVQASPDKPPVDVVLSDGTVLLSAAPSGAFEKVSVKKIPNMADVPAFFNELVKGWGSAFDYGTAGIVYHKGRIKNPPKSIKEFVDRTIKGEWRASLSNAAYHPGLGNVIWSINDALGGTVSNVTPVIEAVKRMKPNCVFWSSVTQFLQHLSSGEADIGIYHDGRTWAYYDAGNHWIDFINPKEGAVANPIYAAKPRGASEHAWTFMNVMLEPEPQAQFAEMMNYAMTNRKTKYPDRIKNRFVSLEAVRLLPIEEMGKHVPMWIERWNKEISA